jgi:signal transduction histidine kinase/CheY-like chemotaxis protein
MMNDGFCIGFVGFDSVKNHHHYSHTEQQLLKLFAQSLANVRKSRDMMQEILASKQRAEQSDMLKTAFLQNLSHEIRTPLNGIIGFSDLLRDPDISVEDRSYYTEIIIERGWQLTSIINDILTISSLETKQEQLYKEVFNLNTLLRNQIAVFSGQAAEKGIELVLTTHLEESRAELLADKTKLGQVLNNLFTNAIKFTAKGRIELSCRLQDNELKFCLQDTGPGIGKEKLNLIFDRFVQADDTIRRTYGGTGLGLSICKGFVELMGGSIWVESEPGQGSVFCFTMPYFPAIKQPEFTLPAVKSLAPAKKMTILVAEDEEYNFIYIEALLTKLGVNILRAYTGKQAIEICKADDVDLVLMDIKMPEMNGYEATMKIREFHPHLPIIAQTAYAEKSEVIRYGNIFNDYITKPFSGEKLLAVIQVFMSQEKY